MDIRFNACFGCKTATHCAHHRRCLSECLPADLASPAASGGTQEFTAAEVNEEIYALGGDRRHRQIRMLHQLARLLSPSPAPTGAEGRKEPT
jgi:hypothetical protein